MKSFDVQVRRGATWKTDSTYDDRELAEQRARQYEATRSSDGVRVIEEAFVEATQKYKRRTVYRDSKFQEDVQTKIDNSRANTGKPKTARQPPASKGSSAPGRPGKPPGESDVQPPLDLRHPGVDRWPRDRRHDGVGTLP